MNSIVILGEAENRVRHEKQRLIPSLSNPRLPWRPGLMLVGRPRIVAGIPAIQMLPVRIGSARVVGAGERTHSCWQRQLSCKLMTGALSRLSVGACHEYETGAMQNDDSYSSYILSPCFLPHGGF